MNPDIWKEIGPALLKTGLGLIVTGMLGVIMWPFRKAHKEWTSMKHDLASVHEELVKQRTNCLTTLQEQGTEQIKLLSKTVEVLDGVRLDLAEQTGYLRAAVDVAPKRRRGVSAKK